MWELGLKGSSTLTPAEGRAFEGRNHDATSFPSDSACRTADTCTFAGVRSSKVSSGYVHDGPCTIGLSTATRISFHACSIQAQELFCVHRHRVLGPQDLIAQTPSPKP